MHLQQAQQQMTWGRSRNRRSCFIKNPVYRLLRMKLSIRDKCASVYLITRVHHKKLLHVENAAVIADAAKSTPLLSNRFAGFCRDILHVYVLLIYTAGRSFPAAKLLHVLISPPTPQPSSANY